MSKKNFPTRCLVIDASIAEAAGTSQAQSSKRRALPRVSSGRSKHLPSHGLE
jgi:hypothetical protein